MYAHTTKIQAPSACERRSIPREEVGNVRDIKELIGEELEDILWVSILKQQQQESSRLPHRSPYQVAKLIPERWIVRLVLSPSRDTSRDCVTTNDVPSPQPPPLALMTLFFEWNTKQEDLGQWKKKSIQFSSSWLSPVTISLDPYQADHSSTTTPRPSSQTQQEGSHEHWTTMRRRRSSHHHQIPSPVGMVGICQGRACRC